MHLLFEYLGEGDTFVVDINGSVIGRFDAAVKPDELEVTDLIESNSSLNSRTAIQ